MAKNKVQRCDDLHNSKLNKVGVGLDASNENAITVRTVSGEDVWSLSDCEMLESWN